MIDYNYFFFVRLFIALVVTIIIWIKFIKSVKKSKKLSLNKDIYGVLIAITFMCFFFLCFAW